MDEPKLDGWSASDIARTADRLHGLRDQTLAKLLGWVVLGNSGAFAFCVSQLVKSSDVSEAMTKPLLISAWIFTLGLALGVVAGFKLAVAMGEYAQHAQELLQALRQPNDEGSDSPGGMHLEAGDQAVKVVGWAGVLSAGCFMTGITGALLQATILS